MFSHSPEWWVLFAIKGLYNHVVEKKEKKAHKEYVADLPNKMYVTSASCPYYVCTKDWLDNNPTNSYVSLQNICREIPSVKNWGQRMKVSYTRDTITVADFYHVSVISGGLSTEEFIVLLSEDLQSKEAVLYG
jgi:hypothetical protein